MPDRSLAMLFFATLLICVACAWLINERYQHNVAWQIQDKGLVFPALQYKLNEVTEIEVARASGRFVLSKQNDRWVNQGVGGFPALQGKVEKAIVAIASLKYKAMKTKRRALYHQLNVADVSATAKSTRLTFKERTGNIVADVIIGKKGKNINHQGLYIRLANNEQTWLVDNAINNALLDVRHDAIDWSNNKLLDIAPSELTAMLVTHQQGESEGESEGESVELYRPKPKATKLSLKNLPTGTIIQHQFQIEYMSGLLKALMFIDAKPIPLEIENTLPTFLVHAETEYGSSIRFKVYTPAANGSVWAQIDAKLLDAANPSPRAKLEVAHITSTFKGWLIKLPRKFTDRLKVKLSDIMRPLHNTDAKING